jgi:hypothetical protein
MSVPWRVLWLGGSSGTGKSTLAQELGRRLGVSVILGDDLRIALQTVTTPAQLPALHTFVSEASPAYHSSEAFRVGLRAVADAMAPALSIVAAHHSATLDAGPVIIEGDGVLPSLAGDAAVGARAVFLHEPEIGAILANLRARGRGFPELPLGLQQVIAEGSWQFGNELVGQALALGLPVVGARPFETVVERVLSALSEGASG